jgi:glycosyltransferase involved in cell wall biosynthesis
MKKISVCLITKNEEKNIEKCLKNLPKNIDEIVIVDGFSKDNTVKISKKFGARIFQRKFSGSYANERNFCTSMARNDWILFKDGDEIFDSKLIKALEEIIRSHDEKYVMYCSARKTFRNGKFIFQYYSYPNFKPVLFNKKFCFFFGNVHETLIVNGKKKFIPYNIMHYHDTARDAWTLRRYKRLNKIRKSNIYASRINRANRYFERMSNVWFCFKSVFIDLKFYRTWTGWKYSFGYILHLARKRGY